MSTSSPSRVERRALVVGITVVVLVALLLAAFWWSHLFRVVNLFRPSPGWPDGAGRSPTVTAVVDGDTIDVRIGGKVERVRLLGIDTPETKDPRKPVQCFGEEASAHTAELLPTGTVVRLVRDVEERDRYDRVLAYVYRASDDLFVNLELVRGGYADLLTYPPNVAHTGELQAAVGEARREQRGLWQACGGPGRPA